MNCGWEKCVQKWLRKWLTTAISIREARCLGHHNWKRYPIFRTNYKYRDLAVLLLLDQTTEHGVALFKPKKCRRRLSKWKTHCMLICFLMAKTSFTKIFASEPNGYSTFLPRSSRETLKKGGSLVSLFTSLESLSLFLFPILKEYLKGRNIFFIHYFQIISISLACLSKAHSTILVPMSILLFEESSK